MTPQPFFPQIEAYKIPIGLFIIWSSAGLNILGIVPVGKTALFLSAIVLTPFLVLFTIAFFHHSGFSFPHLSLKGIGFSSLGMALYTIMWNFVGWDNVTTYAEEVERPVKTYLVSVLISFVLIVLVYGLTVLATQNSGINFSVLSDNGFPALGVLVSGHWLGALIAAGGMASTLGLYSAVLLSVSRVPQVMADDKLLPVQLHTLHPKFKTPYRSIIVCSVIVSAMIWWTFTDLLIIDITLYGAGLFLEFISLIVLRIKAPDEHRPFKIPLNISGLCLMFLLPVGVYIIALGGAFANSGKNFLPPLFAVAAILSAELVWGIIIWRKSKPKSVGR